MKRRRLCLCLVLPALPLRAHHQRSQHANRTAKGWPLAPFELQDQDGAALTLARLQGRWTFVLLGDTRCEAECTPVLQALAWLRRRLAGTQALETLQVLFLTLDAQHDTPQRLRSHLARFDASFVGASGTPAVLQRLVDDLALSRAASGALVLVGPDAVLRAEYLPPYDPQLLTADFLMVRSRR